MIQAKIVADSITPKGERLTTLEIIMPRYILAESKTHRIISGMLEQTTVETSIGLNDEYYLSKNSASSRAIPFNKMVKEVQERPFIPYAWQKDHSGMQGTEYFTSETFIGKNNNTKLYTDVHKETWNQAMQQAIEVAITLNKDGGVTKQLANRLLEPFMYHKVLVSATEWENFFNLRCPSYTFHNDDNDKDFVFKSRKEAIKSLGKDNPVEYEGYAKRLEDLSILDWLTVNTGQADIHMMFLAEAIYDAMNESIPNELKEGEWHIPYSVDAKDENQVKQFSDLKRKGLVKDGWEAQCKISIARCARLSYQTLGDNPVIDYEKDLQLYDILSKSGHWSPFEHVARVMTNEEYLGYCKGDFRNTINDGNTNSKLLGWCRNYKGFIQYRELLD